MRTWSMPASRGAAPGSCGARADPRRVLPSLRRGPDPAHLLQRHRPLLGEAAHLDPRRDAARSRRSRRWVLPRPGGGRPMRFTPDFLSVYEQSAERAATQTSGSAIQIRPRTPRAQPWTFRRLRDGPRRSHQQLALLGAARGGAWRAGPEPDSIDVEIEYRDPAMPGRRSSIREGSSIWIGSSDGAVHASIAPQPRLGPAPGRRPAARRARRSHR